MVRMSTEPVGFDVEGYPLEGEKADFCWRNSYGRLSSVDKWSFPERVTPELAEWIGLVWGDGSIVRDGVRLTVTDDEADDAADVFERLFGWKPSFLKWKNRKGSGVLSVNARWLVEWMEHNGLRKPTIPEVIMRSGKAEKSAFLRGLFAADGSVARDDGGVSLSTKHKELACQVRLLLRCEFGLESCLTEVERGRPGDFVDEGVQYIVSVRGKRALFAERIGFSYSRKAKTLEEHGGIVGRRKFVRVVKVESSSAVVHDLEVEGDPSYVANGFVNHNSVDTIQQLRKHGIEAEVVSVDKTTEPYDVLKAAMYEDRFRMQKHGVALQEFRTLQRVPHGKGKVKIDHPKRNPDGTPGSKDVADSIAGVVYSLTQRVPGRPMPPMMSTREGFDEQQDNSWVTEGRTLIKQAPKPKKVPSIAASTASNGGQSMSMPFVRG